jgi:predicted MFS family arabinose efflux permease
MKRKVIGAVPGVDAEEGRRSTAFGLSYLGYGGGWLIGSVMTGLLYDRSRAALIMFACAVLLASVPFFVLAVRAETEQPADGQG